MAVRTVVTRGFGNGTFNGTIALVTTRGYATGEAAVVTGGGRRRRAVITFPPIIPRDPAQGIGAWPWLELYLAYAIRGAVRAQKENWWQRLRRWLQRWFR